MVEVLLHHQADVNARDKYWRTPFHVAAASNSLGCAAALLARLANINITDRAGRSGLHHAAYCGHREMVELLVDRWRQSPATRHPRGANVNAVDKRERRPLHWAAHTGCEDSLRALVAAGAEVRHLTNLPSPHGTSPHPPSPPGLALTSHPGECPGQGPVHPPARGLGLRPPGRRHRAHRARRQGGRREQVGTC